MKKILHDVICEKNQVLLEQVLPWVIEKIYKSLCMHFTGQMRYKGKAEALKRTIQSRKTTN